MLQHLEPCFTNDCILLCNILVNLIVTWYYTLEHHITFTYKHLFFSYFSSINLFYFLILSVYLLLVCVWMCTCLCGSEDTFRSCSLFSSWWSQRQSSGHQTWQQVPWPWGSLLVSFVFFFFFKPRKEHFMLEDASSRVLPFFVIC